MTRMFGFVDDTSWNPIVGCEHQCSYCWARRMARRFRHRCRDCYRFVPHVHSERFSRRFKPNTFLFVGSMSDIMQRCFPSSLIRRILDTIRGYPETTFLLETKNPMRYMEFMDEMPSNVVLSATIETNDFRLARIYSKAPIITERWTAMSEIDWGYKHISIEPIMKFDLYPFLKMIGDIEPKMVSIGYDNHNNHLPEPSLKETIQLKEEIEAIGIKIDQKTFREAWWENHV